MYGELIRILDGNTFVMSDRNGDIDASPVQPTGFFASDTRFLSRWKLTVNGGPLHALSVDNLQYFEARFFLVLGTPSHYVDATVSVMRERSIGRSMEERLTILNHGVNSVDLRIRLDAGNDFIDIFEVKDIKPKKGRSFAEIADGRLLLNYERENFRRSTVISSSEPAEVDDQGFTFVVQLEPRAQWATDFAVETLAADKRDVRTSLQGHRGQPPPEVRVKKEEWLAGTPRLNCDYDPLKATYRRSLTDLSALRYSAIHAQGQAMPAAGLPWFMSVFGRDSIFTSLQALPFAPDLAAITLETLAGFQGTRLDDFRDEEPGKIMHEFRYGESAAFEEQPHSPYFGTADATPLYIVLLDEYERWTGDAELVRRLEPFARAAIQWIGEYGDIMQNGYIWYARRNERTGLANQCWKDSWDSISYRDGSLPQLPRATCECQGYAFDAQLRAARLARQFWHDPAYAEGLERQAAELKDRFNRDYWIADRGYYAVALDADGRQVDSLSSNIGHLLWSGIVEESRADMVVDHLMGPSMFSGWGVRTLSDREFRYNPVGYHIGTVWPFDNSFIAWGLRRYGYPEEAARIAAGIIEASEFFNGRLPEAFGGYDRELTRYPVEYPTACSPQAWSSGAPLLLLRAMLGMDPAEHQLRIDPALPPAMKQIELRGVPGRWGLTDVAAKY